MVSLGTEEFRLRQDDSLKIPGQSELTYIPSSESLTLSVVMDPNNKLRPANN